MRTFLTALLACVAGLIATTAQETNTNPLAPTGLTLVICDSENKVLDTVVVPEGKVSFKYTFTMPEDLVEIRLFAIGDDRINKHFRDNMTQSYSQKLASAGSGPKSRVLEATVKDGVLKGFNWINGLEPLTITDEMRDQIQKDIKEDKRSSVVSIKGEQGGGNRPSTTGKSTAE